MKKWMVVICIICTAGVRAEVLFQDTFDVPDSQDINSDYGARQSNGTISVQYTGDIAAVAISGNKFYQEGKGEVELGTNLASSIVGSNFELSFELDMHFNGIDGKYASIYLESANEEARSESRFGFHMWSYRSSSAYLFTVYYGTGGAGDGQESLSFTTNAMNEIWQDNFGTDFDADAAHEYRLVSTEGGTFDSYDFIIDGITVAPGLAYTFSEDTKRVLNIYSSAYSSEGGALIDDLMFEVTPAPTNAVFFDSFNSADSQDINTNYTARQSIGTITAQYTGGISAVAISESSFYQEGRGEVELGTNLANSIVGENFELSLDMSMHYYGIDSRYTSVYLESANEDIRGESRFGFHIWSYRSASDTLFTIYHGTDGAGAAQAATSVTTNGMNAIWQSNFGTDFNAEDMHTYRLVSTEGGAVDTCDFVVDGVTVVSNLEYAFSEDTTRILNIYGHALSTEGGATIDNLAVLLLPQTESGYNIWASGYGVGSETADDDGDGLSNLAEYGLGGNPTNATDRGNAPVYTVSFADSVYVYPRLQNATDIEYFLEVTENLTGTWTNIGYTVTGTNQPSGDFEYITNSVPMDADQKFIRLRVSTL